MGVLSGKKDVEDVRKATEELPLPDEIAQELRAMKDRLEARYTRVLQPYLGNLNNGEG
jgi:hypothetical protein